MPRPWLAVKRKLKDFHFSCKSTDMCLQYYKKAAEACQPNNGVKPSASELTKMPGVKGLYDLQEHILYRYIFFENNKKTLLHCSLDWNKTQICQEKCPNSLRRLFIFQKKASCFSIGSFSVIRNFPTAGKEQRMENSACFFSLYQYALHNLL